MLAIQVRFENLAGGALRRRQRSSSNDCLDQLVMERRFLRVCDIQMKVAQLCRITARREVTLQTHGKVSATNPQEVGSLAKSLRLLAVLR